jgi:acyl-CoA reductase-like NAD-dependent aldehyde dehydrogenase
MSKRLAVPKTYKLYIGGAFPRSESGRTYEVASASGAFLANAALASRKDARDAVVAARGAVSSWAGATAYNRGQVLYRVAELLEGRRAQFVDEIVQQTGATASAANAEVDEAIDRWVWYAGWCDKFGQVRTSTSRSRSRRASSRSSRRRTPRSSGSSLRSHPRW